MSFIRKKTYRVSQKKTQHFWSEISKRWFAQINCSFSIIFSIAIQFYRAQFLLSMTFWSEEIEFQSKSMIFKIFYLYIKIEKQFFFIIKSFWKNSSLFFYKKCLICFARYFQIWSILMVQVLNVISLSKIIIGILKIRLERIVWQY